MKYKGQKTNNTLKNTRRFEKNGEGRLASFIAVRRTQHLDLNKLLLQLKALYAKLLPSRPLPTAAPGKPSYQHNRHTHNTDACGCGCSSQVGPNDSNMCCTAASRTSFRLQPLERQNPADINELCQNSVRCIPHCKHLLSPRTEPMWTKHCIDADIKHNSCAAHTGVLWQHASGF